MALSLMTKEFALIYYIVLLFFIGHSVVTGDLKLREAISAFSFIIASSAVVLFLFWLPCVIENTPWAP
jgi:hypothetical protein